jgi:hypothetical protein
MRHTRSLLIVFAFVTTSLFAQERKIDRKNLPAAVEKTLQANLGGATIKGFATEMEGGKRVYEAETILNGHIRDLQFGLDGSLNEIEEEVAVEALPASVKKALTAKAGSAKITRVESLIKKGKLVAYEASTLKGTRKGEVQSGPNGETLKHGE